MASLIQLHWQNRSNDSQTEFVAQTEDTFGSPAELHAWANEIIDRRGNEIPEGWCPMLCNDQSEYFVRQAATEGRDDE